jgi:DUF4097 and DUF4098 domain-containing protein YvlB
MIIEKEFKASMGQTLSLKLKAGGAVDIAGWDEERVAVIVDRRGKDRHEYDVDFHESPSGIEIASYSLVSRPTSSVDFKFAIKVPRRFDIKIESAGGSCNVTGVTGDIKGSTRGGELNLRDLKGELKMKTEGGNITVAHSNVKGKVETAGGHVLIQDVVGGLKGSSRGGQVIYRNSTGPEREQQAGEVHISTMGGAIRIDAAPAGADLSTMGGAISIGSAAEYVKARTNGGNISIDEVDGWVLAETMAGDVNIRMIGNTDEDEKLRHVEIVSMCGEVTLTVPANLSMQIDISLAQTENSRAEYRIVSDFEVDKSESEEWVSNHETPIKHFYATGSNAGGRNKVKINTVNGNVYLKKGAA